MENSDWRTVFVQHRHLSEAEISLLPTETGRERERRLFTKVWAMWSIGIACPFRHSTLNWACPSAVRKLSTNLFCLLSSTGGKGAKILQRIFDAAAKS
jgi:hypothetical protein